MNAPFNGGANKIAGMRTAPAQTVVVTDAGVTAVPLAVAAASATDIFTVTSDASGDTIITRNGTTIDDVPTDSLLSLSITGGPAYVGIDFTAGDPIPVGGFFSDASQDRNGDVAFPSGQKRGRTERGATSCSGICLPGPSEHSARALSIGHLDGRYIAPGRGRGPAGRPR